MAGSFRKNNSALFEKDENVLPFFSLHPRTKVGMILRIILYVFLAIVCVLTVLASKAGLMFYKYYDLYYLIYAVPILICIALVIVALFKRMKRTITKILVPGMLGLVTISLALALLSVFSASCSFMLSPAMILPLDEGKYMFMVSCADPDGTVEKQNEKGVTYYEYPVRVDAYRYSAKGFGDDSCTVTGEILIPQKATYEVKEEWVDESTLRFYIASDNSELGTGEIIVKFGEEGESVLPGEGATFRSRFNNKDESHTADLYREDSVLWTMTDSVYSLGKESFKQVFTAYPLKMRYFIKLNERSDGAIILEPYGSLYGVTVDKESVEDGILFAPAEGSVGASGSITVYPGENVELNLNGKDAEE